MTRPDYASSLRDIEFSPSGSRLHPNVVSIAFCDYTFARDRHDQLNFGFINSQVCSDGQLYSAERLKEDIRRVQRQGGKIKVSFGGATFPFHNAINSEAKAREFASRAAEAVVQYGLDGVDFDFEDRNSNGDLQVGVITSLRSSLPDKLLTLTVPAISHSYEPSRQVIASTTSLISALNVMAYDTYWKDYNASADFLAFTQIGVPKAKLVWGVMPGPSDCPHEFTSERDAYNIAHFVKSQEMAGVMIWSINRDTNRRSTTERQSQTGLPDGTFTRLFGSSL